MGTSHYCEIAILGGGVVGALAAVGLSKKCSPVAIIESRSSILQNLEHRVFAISKRSKDFLLTLNVWDELERKCHIDDIMIFDQNSNVSVHYNYKDVSSEPMGYIVEGKYLAHTIKDAVARAESRNDIIIHSSTIYENVCVRNGLGELELRSGDKIVTPLIVCAEGKNSKFHQLMSIRTLKYNHRQSSITCNVLHEIDHKNTAIEHFFSSGPLALLPMYGGNKSSVVLTEKSHVAKMLMHLTPSDFETELQKRCAQHLGKIELNSRPMCHEVSMTFLRENYKKRSVIVGDAAHSIHPVAGQGLNLGIMDIEKLVQNLERHMDLGSDLGQEHVLEEICASRNFDNIAMALITSGISELFSNKSLPLQIIRNLLMLGVESSPIVKRAFIKHGMGIRNFN